MTAPNARKVTILFSGHDLRFLRPFIAWCQSNPRWTVLLDEHQGHEITDPQRCRELLPSADVIFCEWCLGNAVWYSRHKSSRQTLVVRLHLQEMHLPYLGQVDWDNVDAVILICPLNLNLIRERYPFLRAKSHLIYNPIDAIALNQPKLPGAEFNLGLMGICPMRKGPHRAAEIFLRLSQLDSRYTLFVKGRHPRDYEWLWRRPDERAYYENYFADLESPPFNNSVVFETYGDDVPLWLSKIGFILSTSDFEGSHQSVAEGMASGAIPVIRNWAGADALYPAKYVFSSIDEAVQAVLKWRTSARYLAEMESCRKYARERFDQTHVCQGIAMLIDTLRRRSGADVTPRELERRPVQKSPPQIMMLAYLPPGFRGGYRIRVEQEISALIGHNTRVHLACLHPDKVDPGVLRSHRTELTALGCEVTLVPIPGFFDIKLDSSKIRPALDALQRITEAGGLRVVHAEALYCARLGLLLKERCPQLRLVFDCHGTTPEEERLSGAHPARISEMEEWERCALARADLNVFVSEAMHEWYLERYAFDALTHVVVPCCVSDERFPDENAPCPLPLPSGRLVIAYLGTMATWQCGEEMIRLFAQLHRHDPEVCFLCLVPQNEHQKTRALMSRYCLPTERVVLAELPHDAVAAALQGAHAGMLLRRDHPVNRVSSPTKFGEYLAAGVPVVLTDRIGDFSHAARDQGVGLLLRSELLDLESCSGEDVLGILEFARKSQRQRTHTALRCRDFARERLHWKAAITVLARGYDELERTRTPGAGSQTLSSV